MKIFAKSLIWFKAVLHFFSTWLLAQSIETYLKACEKDGIKKTKFYNSCFYGSDVFIGNCIQAARKLENIRPDLADEILKKKGVVLFEEDKQIGRTWNPCYLNFSVSSQYLSYGVDGVFAFLVYACIVYKDFIRLGFWTTGVSRSTNNDLNQQTHTLLKQYGVDPMLLHVFTKTGNS